MSFKKRQSDSEDPPSKKTHPFFVQGAPKILGTYHPSEPSLVHYTHLEPFSSLSQNGRPTPKKIAISFYDLDGTLIKPRSGAQFPKDRNDWMWWDATVPAKLKQEHEEGRHLVILSNQGDKREKIKSEWRAKLPLIATKMPKDIPLRILAALEKNHVYRKPNIGMFDFVSKLYRDQGLEIDMEHSVFVGDAAGRPAKGGRRKDHGNTDLKFAVNVGLKFLTPEEHFLQQPRPSFPEPPIGFRPASLGNLASLPHITPSHTPIARSQKEIEIVLFVGYPASGKSTFYRRHFETEGYGHVNQDKLKTRDKCLSVGEKMILEGRSIVVDNTNRDRVAREYWIALSKKLNVPIRAFHFLCPEHLARHNNLYRAYYPPANEPRRTVLPAVAFHTFHSAFQPPEEREGFDEVRRVNFCFEGTDDERKLWDMYIE